MTILIAGAAKGLGSAIAIALAKQGHSLVLHYRHSQKEAVEVARSCRKEGVEVALLQGDFSSVEGTEKFMGEYLERFSSTYGLVYNVGNYLIKPAESSSIGEWQELFQTNLHAPILMMNRCRAKRTIMIGAVGGRKKAFAYSMSKQALLEAVRGYAKDWAPLGITVNMVSPGVMENSVDLEAEKLPMGKPASLHEVARVVAFLCAEESSYITGQNIEVAGGFGL